MSKDYIKMVPSFMIYTTIRVEPLTAYAFNLWVDRAGTSSTAELPLYFDQAFIEDMEPFNKNIGQKQALEQNNWIFNEEGLLIDCSEKFHGAITALDWCIEKFFAPRGVMLNGIVVGVNTEYAMLYIYRVKDNVIEIDMDNTRSYLNLYKKMWDTYEADDCNGDWPTEKMLEMIVSKLG